MTFALCISMDRVTFLLRDCTVSFHIAHEIWIGLCIVWLYIVVNMKHWNIH